MTAAVRTTPAPAPGAAPTDGLADLRGRIVAGAPAGDLRGVPPRVRRAVEVALAVGAPLVPAIDAAVAAIDDDRKRDHAVHVATAQSRAVAGGLLALPVLLVPGLGRLLGVDLLAFYATTAGHVVLAVALLLIAVGALTVRAIVRRATSEAAPGGGGWLPVLGGIVVGGLVAGTVGALLAGAVAGVARLRRGRATPADPALDEVADLVATALAGGTSLSGALRLVARRDVGDRAALERLALAAELGRLGEVDVSSVAPLARVLTATQRWGAPAAASLRALARDLRADRLAGALAAAERLPAQLTFPTALCLLPASVLLLGAPIVADGLATAGGLS